MIYIVPKSTSLWIQTRTMKNLKMNQEPLPPLNLLNKPRQNLVQTQLGPEKQASALSVIIAHSWALKVIASFKLGVSQFTKFRVAFCRCCAPCPCFASCTCCHDPFIVRSAQTCPPFTGFTQLAHPSRCSRSTLTTVYFCTRSSSCVFSPGLCVHFGSAALHQIQHRLRHLHLVVE